MYIITSSYEPIEFLYVYTPGPQTLLQLLRHLCLNFARMTAVISHPVLLLSCAVAKGQLLLKRGFLANEYIYPETPKLESLKPEALGPKPLTLRPKAQALSPKLQTPNPQGTTLPSMMISTARTIGRGILLCTDDHFQNFQCRDLGLYVQGLSIGP